MPQVFFRCSSRPHIAEPLHGQSRRSDGGARAGGRGRTFLALPGADDWRRWVLHVIDDLGEEIFALPFTSIMGRVH